MGWQVLVPNHREKVLLFATCLGAGADIILNFLMIPGMGVKGAALATLLSECLVFSVCVREAGRYLNIREVLSHLVLYAAASLPIPALSLFLKNLTSSLLTFVIAVPAAGILYLIILLLCREELVTMCMQKLKRRK
jgi:O-antigen/teichoic acid export membrane protein